MEKRTKKLVLLFLASFLVLSKSFIAEAEALPDVVSGSSTLADCIMSYYAMVGTAVANSDWINSLYNAFGESFGTVEELAQQGYLVLNETSGNWEPVQELGEKIANVPAYESLGLNDIFNVSAAEVAQGGGAAAASGASVLAGTLGGVATTGTLPLFVSTTASYWGGIAIGTLATHVLQKYAPWIYNGFPIPRNNDPLEGIPVGAKGVIATFSDNSKSIYIGIGCAGFSLARRTDNTGQVTFGIYNYTSSEVNGIRRNVSRSGVITDQNVSIPSKSDISQQNYNSRVTELLCANNFALRSEYEAWKNGAQNNPDKSPDLIGENGNQTASVSNGQYTVPNIKPMIDPGTQAGKPLTLQDWLNFANAVSNNNSQSNPDGNKDLYDNLLPVIVTGGSPDPGPDPGPDPWSPPVVDPVPDPSYPDPVPDQPTSENPEESENPQETEPLNPVDTGKPWMLPDLTKKFPFCIPWDIKDCFTLLKTNIRQAPHITWRFNPPHTPIDYTFNLDLSDFEPVATLLRTLELIAFIAGLAFATRYLIGAS